jgi:hypothetical protein
MRFLEIRLAGDSLHLIVGEAAGVREDCQRVTE